MVYILCRGIPHTDCIWYIQIYYQSDKSKNVYYYYKYSVCTTPQIHAPRTTHHAHTRHTHTRHAARSSTTQSSTTKNAHTHRAAAAAGEVIKSTQNIMSLNSKIEKFQLILNTS